MKRLLCLISFLSCSLFTTAQGVFVNSPNGFYELTGSAGSCANAVINNECLAQSGSTLLSMALFKDTVYFNTFGTGLFSFKLGTPGSCRSYGNVLGSNSLTVDRNGILYSASNTLESFNPYTGVRTVHGSMPFSSAGDLIFYNDKLLMAGTPAGIYEINISNPAASTLYLNTNGTIFYGLISYPVTCGNTRFFGLSPTGSGTDLVELDLVNRTVLGTVCAVPVTVYDAGSITEGGLPSPAALTALHITHPCPPATTGSIQALTPLAPGAATFTLDNTITNSTGSFNGIATGAHTLRVTTTTGCTIDTSFQILAGLNPQPVIQITAADDCDNTNGQLTITANSPHNPLRYTLNGGTPVTTSVFSNLSSGVYTLSVADTAGCRKDSIVTLPYTPGKFKDTIIVKQEHCSLDNGSLSVRLRRDTLSALTSLNNGPFISLFTYNHLSAGSYYLQIKEGANCYFDTTIVINDIPDIKPAINIAVTNQLCYTDNGQINITATGPDMPYAYQLNTSPFTTQGSFSLLPAAAYNLRIRNANDCTWDTFATVMPYPKFIPAAVTRLTHPTCRIMNDGGIQVTITGTENPYRFIINGREYINGQTAMALTEGSYTVYIKNKDGCLVDSLKADLKTAYEPQCNEVYMPSAFTPDNNGRNDYFRPLASSFIKNLQFQVYNRYGQQVYGSSGFATGWDGTFNSMPQPPGIFVYMVRYTDYFGQHKMKKGTFVLIR